MNGDDKSSTVAMRMILMHCGIVSDAVVLGF